MFSIKYLYCNREFELSNHLGNVQVTISDKRIRIPNPNNNQLTAYYLPEVLTTTDYYPFGMQMPSRTFSATAGVTYKFGFNGMEKDDEITGVTGSHYTALYWEYDARLAGNGRWNPDPKPNPSVSPYACFNGNPILYTDVLGDSSVWNNKGYMIHYDPNDKDLRAFMQDGDNLTLIGELGGNIDASKWFSNLLKENSQDADDIWNPLTFKENVQQYGKWDYKYLSPANPDANVEQHILGVAFYRKDKAKGSGDLPETMFSFNGNKGRAEDLNNFHFGVVGKAYGLFSETLMLKTAGGIEMDKWKAEGKQVPASWRPIITIKPTAMPATWYQEMGAPYGDNPTDHEWIKKGFRYYDLNRSNLDGDLW